MTIKTIHNWEKSRSPIPYAAFRMMRMLGSYMLADKGWENWTMWKGKLYSPAGRSFEPHELLHIGNYFTAARLYLEQRKSLKAQTVTIPTNTASSATALCGVAPCRNALVIPFPVAVGMELGLTQDERGKLAASRLRSMQAPVLRWPILWSWPDVSTRAD